MAHPSETRRTEAVDRQLLTALVEDLTGVLLPEARVEALARSVSEIATREGVAPVRVMSALAGGPSADVERQRLVEAVLEGVPTPETYFFRDRPQLEALCSKALPELIARRPEGGIRVWSAGCATGEEAWTLAFLLEEHGGPEMARRSIVLGTDLSRALLRKARTATYSTRSLRSEEIDWPRWLERLPLGRWRVREPWRNRVQFLPHNLVTDPLPDPERGLCGMDLIVCRNVLQYFSPPMVARVVGRLFHCLAPGGYLVVAHAEYDLRAFRELETIAAPGTLLYRKPGLTSELADQQAPRGGPGRQEASRLYERGREAADRGERERAAELLRESLELEPLHVEARFRLALLLQEENRRLEARQHLRKVLLLQPDHLAALVVMARILRQGSHGGGARAREMLGRARRLLMGRADSEEIEAWEGMTVGDLREAIRVEGER